MTSHARPATLAPEVTGGMRPIGLIVVVMGAAVFAYLAWRRTTTTMYYRSVNSSIPPTPYPA